MRCIFLLFILLLSVSCGQNEGSSKKKSAQEECGLNGNLISCASLRGADGEGIDLLEAMIDVPIKIENTDITFLKDKSAVSTGRRINCRVAVSEGEVYRFALRGGKLLLMTKEGSFEMEKLSDGEGIIGNWMWKGYVDQGTHLIRNLTILGNERMIIRSSCEL